MIGEHSDFLKIKALITSMSKPYDKQVRQEDIKQIWKKLIALL
jgi:hypothetical protein